MQELRSCFCIRIVLNIQTIVWKYNRMVVAYGKLFTDNDLDGLGCGVIAKIAFGEQAKVSYCSYRNLNQRVERFIANSENDREETYITDLAVNVEIEKKLAQRMVQTFVKQYCVGIVHAEQYLSELGNALNNLNPHLDMIALINVGSKKIGFRTIHDEVNVAEFAKTYGGGGHPKASGADLTSTAFATFVLNVFELPPLKSDADRNEFNVKESPYVVSYRNHIDEISYIIRQTDKKFTIVHNGKKLT